VLSREHINVTATSTVSHDHVARMRFTVEVADVPQLQRVLALIRDVRGVVTAARRQ
jgi:GTP pyrophosphokinase